MKNILFAASLLFLSGCSGLLHSEEEIQKLKERAADSFDCPANKLKVRQLRGNLGNKIVSYGIEGCGKQGVYLMDLPAEE